MMVININGEQGDDLTKYYSSPRCVHKILLVEE